MALDRFVRFEDDRPTRDQVEQVLENFFNGAAQIHWNGGQKAFFITLPGKGKFAFDYVFMGRRDWTRSDRWIELFYNEEQFDVITREQDEYTNTIAQGLAELFARGWGGKVDA